MFENRFSLLDFNSSKLFSILVLTSLSRENFKWAIHDPILDPISDVELQTTSWTTKLRDLLRLLDTYKVGRSDDMEFQLVRFVTLVGT